MIKIDEDALICDLAETYQIYDYRQLPPTQVAVFALGLRDDSRIKMKFSGVEVPFETFLLARVLDEVSTLVWFNSEDGANNVNRPQSVVNLLLGKETENEDVVTFSSGEDYEEYRKNLMKGG